MSESTSISSFKLRLPWLDELLQSHGYNTFQLRDNVIDRFEQEQIDEKTFFLLSEQDFIDLGVPLGPRKAFARIVTGEKHTPKESQPPTSPAKSLATSSPSSPPLEEQTTTISLPWLDELYDQHLGDKKGNKKSNEETCAAASASGEPTPEPPAAPADLTQILIQNKITEQNVFTALTETTLTKLQPTPAIGTLIKLELLLERVTRREFAVSNSSNGNNYYKNGLAANRSSSWGSTNMRNSNSNSSSIFHRSATANSEKTKNNAADDDDGGDYSAFLNFQKAQDTDNIDDDQTQGNNNNENGENAAGDDDDDDDDTADDKTEHNRVAVVGDQENNKSVFISELKDDANKSFRAGDHHRALELYSRALSVDPQPHVETHAALLSNRSACYLLLQQPEKALEDAEACLRLRPEWIKGHIRKIKALKELGRKEELLEALIDANRFNNGDPQLVDFVKQLRESDDRTDKSDDKKGSTRQKEHWATLGQALARSDYNSVKSLLDSSTEYAREVIEEGDADGDNCLGIACYVNVSPNLMKLILDKAEELGLLEKLITKRNNKKVNCAAIACGKNLHHHSLDLLLKAATKVKAVSSLLDLHVDPNPLTAACIAHLNTDSLILLLHYHEKHSPITAERANVIFMYAALNGNFAASSFHVLLRATNRIFAAAGQPLLFSSKFNGGLTPIMAIADNNRTDLLKLFIPFFDSAESFAAALTTKDSRGNAVTSPAHARIPAVRELLKPESFSLLRNKYKLIYGRTAQDTKDPLENTNIKIPWLQELFPGEPLDEPTVNLLIDNEIDKTTVFGLKERDIQDFPLRIRTTLLNYIRLKNPSNSNVKVGDFVTEQAQLNAANNNAASSGDDNNNNNNNNNNDGAASDSVTSDYKTERHYGFADNESISATTNETFEPHE